MGLNDLGIHERQTAGENCLNKKVTGHRIRNGSFTSGPAEFIAPRAKHTHTYVRTYMHVEIGGCEPMIYTVRKIGHSLLNPSFASAPLPLHARGKRVLASLWIK